MRNEAAFWKDFVKPALQAPGGIAWKTATLYGGLPDVWFVRGDRHGWVELKFEPEWPKRASTRVRVDATTDQLAHLRTAHEHGAVGAVLIGIEKQWFLLTEQAVRHQPDQSFLPEELAAMPKGQIGKAHQEALRQAIVGFDQAVHRT